MVKNLKIGRQNYEFRQIVNKERKIELEFHPQANSFEFKHHSQNLWRWYVKSSVGHSCLKDKV